MLLYTHEKLSRLKSTSLRLAVEKNKTYLIGAVVLCPAEVKSRLHIKMTLNT